MADPDGSTCDRGAEDRLLADATPEADRLGRCLVTGAAGLLGRNLVRALLERGCEVRALVHSTPLHLSHRRLECLAGDVRSARDMRSACEGVDTVFHTAALISLMGGWGASGSYRRSAHEVNVRGTKNTLAGCRRCGVRRLVYTSSVDVCFDGSPTPNMHEEMPYAARVKSVYAETKIAAEKLVLEASGRGRLLTCAIRPDGIYGAEPNQLLDRLVAALRSGRLLAAVGDGSTLQDNSHLENLVHGEILAAMNLFPGGAACGRAFFITDDSPQNAFEFFRPLIEGLGFEFPRWRIPRRLLMPVLLAWQFLHFRLRIPPPVMTPHELDKVSVTHFASIASARERLGYRPVKTVAEAMEECLPYCRSLLAGRGRDVAVGARPRPSRKPPG